ncbi:MAG: hypothetical protein M0P64_01100 [Candidatus Pacebacteria bacterium]|jgi:hypothetical protein|nr:hypothetical protein [Candidatus Paceibacterota bacterium]
MERPGNPNSHHENRGNVDSSLGAQLKAKGYVIETTKIDQDENQKEELKKLLEAKLREKTKGEDRNHEGNGRQAGPELTAALKEAGVITAAERASTVAQFNKERSVLINEIAEAKNNIVEALTKKEGRLAHNWDIRLKKSKDILRIYEEAASLIDSDVGKHALESVRGYAKLRYNQAAKELVADSFVETGKFVAQNPAWVPAEKIKKVEKEPSFKDGVPVLTGFIDPKEIRTVTKERGGRVETKYKGDNEITPPVFEEEKLTPSERVSHPQAIPTERVSYPRVTPTERISHPEETPSKLTPSETISSPEKKPREISRVAPGIYDLAKKNKEEGQRDMDGLFKLTPSETISYPTEEKLAPSESVSYPQEESVVTLVDNPSEETSMKENFEAPTGATADNWQERALEAFENEGGKIAHENIPSEESPIISASNEAILKEVEVIAKSEAAPELNILEVPLSPEQATLREKLLNKIGAANEAVDKRAEKLPSWALEKVRSLGETWNKVPLREKLLISTGMIISGSTLGLGAAATPAFIAASIALRSLGGVGMFTAIDQKLKERFETKNGTARSQKEEATHLAIAGGIAIIVAGVLPSIARDYALNHWFSPETPGAGATTTPEGGASAPTNHIEIAQPGDSVWKMAERGLAASLGEKFTALSAEQQTYLIDAVKDQVVGHPDQFGLTDASALQVGQGIDFGIVLNNGDFIEGALAEAKGLSAEDVANIKGGAAGAAETVPQGAHAGTPEAIISPSHPTAEAAGLKVTFSYNPDGSIKGYSASEVSNFVQHAEAEKLLNDNWREVVRNHSQAGMMGLDISSVNTTANTLFQYDQVLNALEQKGAGNSPEANFLREQLERLVVDTEKEYGDVFKDTTELFKPEAVSPTLETPPVAAATPVQEVLSTDPKVLEVADKQFHNHVDNVFGSKGFFGFGAVDGTTTPNWKDPEVGFANKTIEEIMGAKPIVLPGEEVEHFGIEDRAATEKMQDYLMRTFNETGIKVENGETAEKYLKRVSMLSVMHKG